MKKLLLISLFIAFPLFASQPETDTQRAYRVWQGWAKKAAEETDRGKKAAHEFRAVLAQAIYEQHAEWPSTTVAPVQSTQSRSWLSTMLTFPFNHPRKTIALAWLAYCVNKARHEDNRGKYGELWDYLKEEYHDAVNTHGQYRLAALIFYAGVGSGLLLKNLLIDGFNGVQEDGKDLGIAALHNAWKKVRGSLPWPFGKKEEKSSSDVMIAGTRYVPADKGDGKRSGR